MSEMFQIIVLGRNNMKRIGSRWEDYLKAISILADERKEVRVTDIAVRLKVTKPSVFSAVKSLEDRGLVVHERYGCVIMTPEGTVEAANIRERYRFLTSCLREIMGISPENAEKDACKLEHILSVETLKKMKAFVSTTSHNMVTCHGVKL
jgi:DtxR family Mn-dependent transcriptional regulator